MKLFGIFLVLFLLPNVLLAEDQLENKLISEGINALKDVLRDPDSAKIRNTSVKYHDEFKTSIVCGEVNSKNAYGGYTGFQGFYAFFQTRTNSIDIGFFQAGSEMHKILWNDFCLK